MRAVPRARAACKGVQPHTGAGPGQERRHRVMACTFAVVRLGCDRAAASGLDVIATASPNPTAMPIDARHLKTVFKYRRTKTFCRNVIGRHTDDLAENVKKCYAWHMRNEPLTLSAPMGQIAPPPPSAGLL